MLSIYHQGGSNLLWPEFWGSLGIHMKKSPDAADSVQRVPSSPLENEVYISD